MLRQKLGTSIALGVLLLSALVVIVPSGSSQGLATYTEGFENGVPLLAPFGDFYTHVTGGSGSQVSRVENDGIANTGTKYWERQSVAENTAALALEFDLCDGVSSWTYWVRYDDFVGGTNSVIGIAEGIATTNTESTAGNELIAVNVLDTTGGARITVSSTTSTSTTTIGTLSADTWYDFTFLDLNCSTAEVSVVSQVLDNSLVLDLGGSFTDLDNFVIGDSDGTVGVDFSSFTFVDDIEFVDIPSVAPIIAATSTVAVTGLTGFDTLDNGGHVIARTNSGDFVRTYTGETLVNVYSEDTNCLNNNGVVAFEDQGFGYFICDGGDIDHIKFIDGNGIKYPFANCFDAPTCSDVDGQVDLGTALGGGAEENSFNDIVDLASGEVTTLESDGPDFTRHSFLLGITSATDGRYYALAVNFQEHSGASDIESANEEHITFSPTAPDDICSNHLLRAYVVGDDSSTRGYEITVASNGVINSPITNPFTGLTSINTADTIACSKTTGGVVEKILIGESQSADTVVLYNIDTSSVVWTITPVAAASEVALSENGEWGMYSTSSTSYIINATSGELTCQLTHPAGTFVDNDVDELGQRAWVATTTNIAYYAIQEEGCTTTTPESEGGGSSSSTSTTSGTGTTTSGGGCLGCTVLPSTGPGSRPFGIDINYVAEGLNISALGVQVLIGLILCVVFAIWLYRGTGSIVAAMFGIGLGLAVATVIGLVPPWVVMAIVLGLLIILGKMLFGAFTGGGEDS